MARRYVSSSSDDEPVISTYSLRSEALRQPRNPATTKQLKAPVTRLLSNIASKIVPAVPQKIKLEGSPPRVQPVQYPTHSRDPTVLRPYSPPLDGPQYSPKYQSRPFTPSLFETTPMGNTPTIKREPRGDFRTPTQSTQQKRSLPSSPTDWGRSSTFSGHTSPQPSIPDSLSPDFTERMHSFDLEKEDWASQKHKVYHGGRKRKFLGNQFTRKRQELPTNEPPRASQPLRTAYSPIPVNMPHSLPPAVSKLQYLQQEVVFTQAERESQLGNENIIINIAVFQTIFNQMTLCKACHQGSIKLVEKDYKSGCALYIVMACNHCQVRSSYWTVSGKFREKIAIGDKQVAKRNTMMYSSILGGRLIGIGHKKLMLYHAAMNLPSPSSSCGFTEAQTDLITAANYIAQESMDRATTELRTMQHIGNSQYLRTMVSYDGAYQQRSGKSGGGFSRYCFGAAISVETGKVLSYGVACNSCRICSNYANQLRTEAISYDEFQEKKELHAPHCAAKYSAYASVQLESALAPSVVRSALSRGIIFSGIVTDGDNKTYEVLRKADLYREVGADIERLECLAHVAKRLKTNLCKAQEKCLKSNRTEKEIQKRLMTAKSMPQSRIKKELGSFKGKLRKDSTKRAVWGLQQSKSIQTISDATAAQIASYFKLAVKRNPENVRAIVDAVNAIPLHLSANDDNADEHHRLCPKGHNSWCRYQSALSKGIPFPRHPNYLSLDAAKVVEKVFKEFAYNTPNFIEKVQQGHTSNHNESLHSVLWTMVHKNEYASTEMMELGSALAVIRYNEGYQGIRKLFDLIQVPISTPLSQVLHRMDKERVLESHRIISEQLKRYAKKQRRGKKASDQIQKHGQGYSSGKYSAAQSQYRGSSSESEEELQGIFPLQRIASALQVDSTDNSCVLCGGTEEDFIVGMGIGIELNNEDINWIQCTSCAAWYHMECLGMGDEDIGQDDDWFCDVCRSEGDD